MVPIWKLIGGYEGYYEISSEGEIRRLLISRIIRRVRWQRAA